MEPVAINNKSRRKFIYAYCLLITLIASRLIFSGLVSADQLTERSIALSSSSAGATNVSYTVNFKAIQSAGAAVVDFCANSPLAGQSCTEVDGLDGASVSSTTLGFTDVSSLDNSTIVIAGTMNAGNEVTVKLDGIKNPSSAGTIYARIITFDTKAHAMNYQSEDIGEGAKDIGSVAVAITNTIGFAGQVPESATFCISGTTIAENCTNTTKPITLLGEDTGDGTRALSSEDVSTANVYLQLSTNAISGAVLRLTSDAKGCGGLIRSDDPAACDIAPALHSDIQPGDAKFGVKTSTAVGVGAGATGTLQPFGGSGYSNDAYAFNYANDQKTGVTSLYGDPFVDTNGAPANNQNMMITFGASVSDVTPAGDYATKIGIVVTGRY